MLSNAKTGEGFIDELLGYTGWSLNQDISIEKTDYYLFGSENDLSFVIHPYVESINRKEIQMYMSNTNDQSCMSSKVFQKIVEFFGSGPTFGQNKTYSGCCKMMSGMETFLFIWDMKSAEK